MFRFFNYMNQYNKIAKSIKDYSKLNSTIELLKSVALDKSNSYFKKYASTNLLKGLISTLEGRQKENVQNEDLDNTISKLTDTISEIVNKTTDKRLKSAFETFSQP